LCAGLGCELLVLVVRWIEVGVGVEVGGRGGNVLKFPSSDISLRAYILRTLSATFTEVCFRCYAEHALEGVCEEDSYESVWGGGV
jgi:hypothetical protein